ncbi:unnamed protein product, partial [Amoebophrya sp. A25]
SLFLEGLHRRDDEAQQKDQDEQDNFGRDEDTIMGGTACTTDGTKNHLQAKTEEAMINEQMSLRRGYDEALLW